MTFEFAVTSPMANCQNQLTFWGIISLVKHSFGTRTTVAPASRIAKSSCAICGCVTLISKSREIAMIEHAGTLCVMSRLCHGVILQQF